MDSSTFSFHMSGASTLCKVLGDGMMAAADAAAVQSQRRKLGRRSAAGLLSALAAVALLSCCARTFVGFASNSASLLHAKRPTTDDRAARIQRWAVAAPTATAELLETAEEKATEEEKAPAKAATPPVTDGPEPELSSDMNIDYSNFRDMLAAGDFRAADAESRHLLIDMAGDRAVKRGWVYFSEVKSIPVKDLQTLDNLWRHFSNGKFGFSAQRKIWRQNKGVWAKFALAVSWFTDPFTNRNWPEEFVYTLDAPAGHLPLTNAIRGGQVMQELMIHPAFDKKKN